MRRGLVLLLLAFVVSHAFAQDSTLTRGMAGEVTCVHGMPIASAPLDRLTGLAREENRRHEEMHVGQFTADCALTAFRWEHEPLFRLDLEAQAYCYGVEIYSDTAYVTRRRGDQVRMLSYLWGNSVGFEDIYAAIDKWCHR